MNFVHKYVLFITGDTVDKVSEGALHLLYLFVMRGLQEHGSQGRNKEYVTWQTPNGHEARRRHTFFEAISGLQLVL